MQLVPIIDISHLIITITGVYFDFASEFLTTHNIRPVLRCVALYHGDLNRILKNDKKQR